jgi:predicted permease
MDESAARAAARTRLGDVEAVREVCGDLGDRFAREDRRREWLGALRRDTQYAVRVLLRSPVFSAVAVFTLALGIGATMAIFSVVNRVLLTPLPYSEPERLVNIWEHSPQGDDHNVVSSGNYLDWSRRTQSFDVLGAHEGVFGMALTGDGEPQHVMVNSLTPTAMHALGTAPLLGRTLWEEDGQGAGDVVVLSHALWQQRFGGVRGIVGERVLLNGVPRTVIGVMPAGFVFPTEGVQLWVPIMERNLDPTERRSHNFGVVARLKDGVTVARAQAELSGVARTLSAEHPQFMTGWGVNVVSVHEDLTRAVRPMLLVLLGTVVVVLLIACGNLANLLLARAVARESEFALRSALGAGRIRIARQLITESLVIGLSGGAAGLVLGVIMLRVLLTAAPDDVPMLTQTVVSWRVVGFAAAVTLVSTLLFGLVPALRVARADLHTMLRTRRSGGVRHARVRATLLVAEVMLSVVLLVGAGLLLRSIVQLQRIGFGYRTADLVIMSLDVPDARYVDNAQQVGFYDRLRARLAAVPGVQAVAGTSRPPGASEAMTFSFGIEGRQAVNPSGREDPEELHVVTPEYFQALGIPLRGRAFGSMDRPELPPVVIINEALARKHWPNTNPIGQRIAFRPGETPWLEIVGVAGDTRMASPDQPPVPTMYMTYAQKTWRWLSWQEIIARVSPGADLDLMRRAFQAALWELDDQLPIQRFTTVEERYGQHIAGRAFAMKLVLAFALVALTLSIVGLYGLMAYAVAQQRQEFGVRLALGARSADIIATVLRRSLGLATLGLLFGLAGSLLATRVLDTLLFEVSPSDPLTLTAIGALVLVTAALASWLPAYRAVKSDPLSTLKSA